MWRAPSPALCLQGLERAGTIAVMKNVTIDEVQRDVREYFRRVRAGEAFTVVQDHEPIAEIRPVAPAIRHLRPFGLCAGEFMVPDDFDAPLPEDIVALFEGR
jgi:antitoxin (DNA-binding transcriptional repressor) of toxin-antitoxin stability system